jgi:sulfur-carrier protein
MHSLEIHYFALLREKSGKVSETFHTQATNYAELYSELTLQYDFGLPFEMVQVAVNDEFMPLTSAIIPNSKVVFIPPVAGG